MNGKYPSRGGSSYRGSSMSGSYGGYYHDPYYSSSPSRGGRGASRGRGGSSSYGYYGSPSGYGGRKDIGDSQGHSHGGYPYAHSGSGLTPTSSASSQTPGSAQQASEQVPGYPPSGSSAGSATYDRSIESHGENGYAGNVAPSSGGSNEPSGDDHESARWEHYSNEYSRGNGQSSPRFRSRGRGRGGSGRGSWRGSRGGQYYGRGRASYEYDSYNARSGSGQVYYGRAFGSAASNVDATTTNNVGGSRLPAGEGYNYHGHEEESHSKVHPGARKDESASLSTAAAKTESEKHKVEEARLKREHDHKKNMEFREKHWIERIEATGETRKNLSRFFNELDTVNSKLLDIGTRRAELEIEVNRYNRVLKAEEDRVRLAEEKLEAMNLSF